WIGRINAGWIKEIQARMRGHDFDLMTDLTERLEELQCPNRRHRAGNSQKNLHLDESPQASGAIKRLARPNHGVVPRPPVTARQVPVSSRADIGPLRVRDKPIEPSSRVCWPPLGPRMTADATARQFPAFGPR